ncbi:MAG: DUF402 domain-containing protein [Actinomycetales bacterium]
MTGPDRPAPGMDRGELIVLRNRKWDGSAHWVVPGTYLGADGHGHWIAQRRGSFCSRPGIGFFAGTDALLLVPHRGEWVATYYDGGGPGDVALYVDIATAIDWSRIGSGAVEVNLIDMDLDVLKARPRPGGHPEVFVDDEDEFADHRRRMQYPEPVAELMERTCRRVLDLVRAGGAPFDQVTVGQTPGGTAGRWFSVLKTVPVPSAQGCNEPTKAGT